MAGVGVEAGRLAGGGLVGARRAGGLGGGSGRADVVAGVGVEAGRLGGGGLVGARPRRRSGRWIRWCPRSGRRRRRGRPSGPVEGW